MKAQTKTNTNFTREIHKVGVSLLEKHYAFFKNLANTKFHKDKSKTLLYLIKKYNLFLYKISIMESKQTFTVDYQPKTKDYKRHAFWVDPLVWGEMNDLRKKLGFSMSLILRVMIEWEMIEEGLIDEEEMLIKKPQLYGRAIPKQQRLAEAPLNWKSSSLKVKVEYIEREVKANFLNEFS